MKSRKPKSGFTLIELTIIIAVLAIISFIVASIVTKAADAWVFVKARETALSQGRMAVERMVRELRAINKPVNIITATTTECEFINTTSATVNFRQSGSDLMRNSDILTSGLVIPEGLRFTYYDANLNTTSTKQSMRYITIRLQLIRGSQDITLEDSARIRNL
jgi:type II secretory pathway pseudopilin PulG